MNRLKSIVAASALLSVFMFTGCAGGGMSYSVGVGGGTQTGVATEVAAPLPPMPKTKEIDENILVFNTTLKLAQRISATSMALKPDDKLMVLNFDSEEDTIAVDRLKDGGSGINGVTIIKADTLKAAEDGLISGLLASHPVVEKFNGPHWAEKAETVFYNNAMTAETLEAIRVKFKVTKLFAYRWVAYTPGDTSVLWTKKPTRVRLSCRIIDTATGAIVQNEILTEEYVP